MSVVLSISIFFFYIFSTLFSAIPKFSISQDKNAPNFILVININVYVLI